MKKKLLSLILAICLIIPCGVMLTACGSNPPDNPHTHNWSTTWSTSRTEHWYTCDGCDEKKDKANHNLVDGICSVCEFDTNHTCNFGEYQKDSTGHWQECSICGDTTTKENHDGTICSICGYNNAPVVTTVRDLEIITYDTGTSGVFTLVKLPDGKNMVIDAGNEGSDVNMLVEDKLGLYINPITIDYFVLTNTNAARTGQMAHILQNFTVINLFTPRVIYIENEQHDSTYKLDCYLDALQYVPNTCNMVEVAESNCDITNSFKQSDSNTTYSYTIDFMLPVSTEDCRNNNRDCGYAAFDASIAISIEYQGKTVLISGDATENNIDGYGTKYGNQKNVDVLITSFEASEPYAIVNSMNRPGYTGGYLASISLEAGDYAIISPISSGAHVGSLTDMLASLCGNTNVYLLADESGLLTSTVKITSAGVVSVTAE